MLQNTTDLGPLIYSCSGNGYLNLKNQDKPYCRCFPHYSGAICEHDLQPCSRNPCLNGAECIQDLYYGNYSCNCSANFYGRFCENKIDLCKDEKCSGNGYCNASTNSDKIKCECFSLYNGDKCEIESSRLKVVKTVIKTSMIIAIIILICFYLIIFLSDLVNIFDPDYETIIKIRRKKRRKMN